jgi:chromosome segregation ATPase
MNARLLPVLNVIGCLALTALIIVQWRKEHVLDRAAAGLRQQLADSRAETATEATRRTALERDITILKESIEATQQAAEKSTRELEEQRKLAATLQSEVTVAREQIINWQEAIKQRDDRIIILTDELTRTRQRLEEAIARLREAANR